MKAKSLSLVFLLSFNLLFSQNEFVHMPMGEESKKSEKITLELAHRFQRYNSKSLHQNDNYDSLNSHVLAALIKKIVLAKKQNKKSYIVWGTGKPKREFLHVDDLADATVKIMNLSKSKYNKVAGEKFPFINVGSGSDVSIKDLAKLISKIVGYKGKMIFDKSKPDGTFRKLMDNTKLRKINWKPKISLNFGIKKTIEDFKSTI